MGVTVIVGGQYGSEGKGKTTMYFAKKLKAGTVVRVGGPNSGHTVIYKGKEYKLRMLSAASMLPNVVTVLPAGSYVDVDILLEELELLKKFKVADRLLVDRNASVILSGDIYREQDSKMFFKIASTESGTGSAVARRVMRGTFGETYLAKDVRELGPYLGDAVEEIDNALYADENVIVEGTQGFGLSLFHSTCYPYCTGRDTTASAFLSEAGISPLDVDNVVLVIRRYPIRVGGHSGPLPMELSWTEVSKMSGKTGAELIEYTTVTKHVRRVAEFDSAAVRRAIKVNKPNIIVLNHEDYIDYENTGNKSLTERQLNDVREIEKLVGRKIDLIGNGPDTFIARK